jgi:phosphohistidine phosphatase
VDLFVVRHAAAFERDPSRWPDDSVRPLSPEGEKAFRRSVRGLRRLTNPVRTLLSSPYERAWRTAEILHEVAHWPVPERFDALAADRHAERALAALAESAQEGPLAIVGHQPMLGRLCGILTGGAALELKKGAVMRLDVHAFEPGGATARWLLPPKVLRLLRK